MAATEAVVPLAQEEEALAQEEGAPMVVDERAQAAARVEVNRPEPGASQAQVGLASRPRGQPSRMAVARFPLQAGHRAEAGEAG